MFFSSIFDLASLFGGVNMEKTDTVSNFKINIAVLAFSIHNDP